MARRNLRHHEPFRQSVSAPGPFSGPPARPARDRILPVDDSGDAVSLRNGQVLEGTAVASLDRTIVETASGSRIVLQTAQVDAVCESWDQAWEFRRDATDASNAASLTELLRWCLRHRLFARAWEVLDRLQWVELPASQLESLRRQIVLAEEAHRASLLPRPPATAPAAVVSASDIENGDTILPGEEALHQVRPASFDEPADVRVATIAWPPAEMTAGTTTPERAGEPEAARPLPKAPFVPEIPDLSRTVTQPFVPRDEFDPEIFNRFYRQVATLDGTPAAEVHRAVRALGFPDLQPLIGKPKAPEK
jgi:hypothetical protein